MYTTIPSDHPVIGICGGTASSESVQVMVEQVKTMGGTPLVLANHEKRTPAEDIKGIDALIVMGNNADIDPERYIDKYTQGDPRRTPHPSTHPESATPEGKARAEYEYAIIQLALDMKMPVLGVCGGMQRINIMQGGTLHQHIPDFLGHNDHAQDAQGIAPSVAVQVVHVAPGTTLARMAGKDNAVYTPTHGTHGEFDVGENSMHHQAVEMVGNGLRASAFAEEYQLMGGGTGRLIEAIEADPSGPLKDQFVVGVQWHPEFGASALGPKITGHLVGHAREFAKRNQRVHTVEEVARENALSGVEPPIASLPTPPGNMTERITQRRASAATSHTLAG